MNQSSSTQTSVSRHYCTKLNRKAFATAAKNGVKVDPQSRLQQMASKIPDPAKATLSEMLSGFNYDKDYQIFHYLAKTAARERLLKVIFNEYVYKASINQLKRYEGNIVCQPEMSWLGSKCGITKHGVRATLRAMLRPKMDDEKQWQIISDCSFLKTQRAPIMKGSKHFEDGKCRTWCFNGYSFDLYELRKAIKRVVNQVRKTNKELAIELRAEAKEITSLLSCISQNYNEEKLFAMVDALGDMNPEEKDKTIMDQFHDELQGVVKSTGLMVRDQMVEYIKSQKPSLAGNFMLMAIEGWNKYPGAGGGLNFVPMALDWARRKLHIHDIMLIDRFTRQTKRHIDDEMIHRTLKYGLQPIKEGDLQLALDYLRDKAKGYFIPPEYLRTKLG